MVSGARVAKGGEGDAGTSLRHTIGFWRKDDRNRKTTFIRGYCLKLFSNTDKAVCTPYTSKCKHVYKKTWS